MDVETYFSPQITHFIKSVNPTRDEIKAFFAQSRKEFQAPFTEVLDSTFTLIHLENGVKKADYWIKFECFRNSKKSIQSCLVHAEMILDETSKITSYKELEIKDLKLTKGVHYTGNVGNMTAEFDLVLDYSANKVTGIYHYPKRKGVIYSLSGIITNDQIRLTEYTSGSESANCTLDLTDENCYSGIMKNTNGKVLPMKLCRENTTNSAGI
jgi:hypothetical protein